MTILGPTFAEMLDPTLIPADLRARALDARTRDPLDPLNLFNITWRNPQNEICYAVLPEALTGVQTPIVVLFGRDFPTGAHKVGAAYSVLREKVLSGEVDPHVHQLVWPSTGNYGIGGAWVGCRMGFDSVVILPAGMSAERFERIASYGASVVKTVGSESNVKEIYDKCKELAAGDPARVRVLNQFEVMGNYRFHYHVTGNTLVALAGVLQARGIGRGMISAFTSAMGSAGTIAAGDRLKQVWHDHKIVGLEPIQCPTLYNNGYGVHDIQGIGDKHVTWIHHVTNMDAIMCIDDIECKKGLQLLTEPVGQALLSASGVAPEVAEHLGTIFGISGVCNVLGAIKAVKHYGYGPRDVVATICTDAIDRYRSVMTQMSATYGPMDEREAYARLTSIFHHQKSDWIKDGTPDHRRQWHNMKYYTWVEQQGKLVEELDAQLDPEWWLAEQAEVAEHDRRLLAARG